MRGNTKDIEKQQYIDEGNPGSNCPKRFLVSNTEFTEKAICTASKVYQKKKIEELKNKELNKETYQKAYDAITEKSCICVGLSTATLKVNKLEYKIEGPGVSVCPGPNLAYFDKKVSLEEMVGHIYGKNNIRADNERPNMFLKELLMYIDHFREKTDRMSWPLNRKDAKYIKTFGENMILGIAYYKKKLIDNISEKYKSLKPQFLDEIYEAEKEFLQIQLRNEKKTLEYLAK